MHNNKQNIRLKQKRKLRHLTLIKNNKLRTLNYKKKTAVSYEQIR